MSAAAVEPSKKYGADIQSRQHDEPKQRIRISLASTDVKAIEKVSNAFVTTAKSKGLTVRGPKRLQRERLTHQCLRTPCGTGTKTWDRYELRVYKRIVDIHASTEIMKQISNFATIDGNVDIEVTVTDLE